MDIQIIELRQSLASWRDRTILDCAEIINQAGIDALRSFEQTLVSAGPLDVIWDPAGFAAAAIDREMTDRCKPALTARVKEAAIELCSDRSHFEVLSGALSSAVLSVGFPETEPDDASSTDIQSETLQRTQNAPPVDTTVTRWPAKILAQADDLRRQTASVLSDAAGKATRALRDHTFLHNRLRDAASERIAQRWMGQSGIPRPVMAEISLIISETAAQARMIK